MAVSAWALQEITGETPTVGEPVIADAPYLTITSETP
jgi:hypothetical protein